MSHDPFSFTVPPGGGASADRAAPRYLAPPFDARMVDQGQALFLIHGESRFRRLPLQLVQVLGQCNRFRTLDEHAREAARALGVAPQQTGAIRQALDELVRQELLYSESTVLERLQEHRPVETGGQPPQAVTLLFVRTCGRPGTLDRLLESLGRRALPRGLEQVIILDDEDDAGREATRAVVERHRQGLQGRLALIGPERRRDILDRLAKDAGVDPLRLRWFIEGDAGDDQPSYGASLNFALLLAAGAMMTIVDDDATLDAYGLPDCSARPAFRRRQSSRLHFPEPDWELPGSHYAPLESHPVDLHAELLGAGTGRLAELAGNDAGSLLGDLDPQLWSELSGDSRIRLTSSGTLGDPGTAGMQWLFTEPAEHLKPLCQSEARYRELLGRRRMARSPVRAEATTAFALMTTTMTGIDNRDLLLPTQPRGANEDLLFGALTGFLHPGTLQANLPHMLYHMRPEPRRWQASDVDQPRGINRGSFLTSRIHALENVASGGDAAGRASMLAEAFDNLARTEPESLAWQLRQELLETRSQMIDRIAATREHLEPPPWLDRDFARSLEQHGRIDERQERQISELASNLPRFLASYAGALEDWMATWRYCRDKRIDELLEPDK